MYSANSRKYPQQYKIDHVLQEIYPEFFFFQSSLEPCSQQLSSDTTLFYLVSNSRVDSKAGDITMRGVLMGKDFEGGGNFFDFYKFFAFIAISKITDAL